MKKFDAAALFFCATALTVTAFAVAPDKSDPLYQSKGDQKRSYKFPATGAVIPYRTYVPTNWSPGKKLPLVVVLHGGGLDENAPFERSPAPLKNMLQKMAEEFGYIVVSPNGAGGAYGAPPPSNLAAMMAARPAGAPGGAVNLPPPPDPLTSARSEEDVLNVVSILEQEYGVDTAKEFITGNSMGGIGTVYIAEKHPEKFLAMAPSEGGFDVANYGKGTYKVKGALFIHKQNVNAPDVETKTTEMIRILQGQGAEAVTISIPNTIHENVWFFALPATFHFFDKFVQGK